MRRNSLDFRDSLFKYPKFAEGVLLLSMFGESGRRTLELLSERAADWPFLSEDSDQIEREDEYDATQGVVQLLLSDTLNTMKLAHRRDLETTDEGEMEELGQQMRLLWDGETLGGQKMAQLRKCRQSLQTLSEQREKCDQIVRELGEKYQSVAEKTSSLHNACDRMMSEQTQLAAASEQISANLHYYQRYEWLVKKLDTPKLSLTGTLFTQILSTIHECLQYLRAHPEQREAAIFIQKYEQCLSRSLTAVKAGVLSDLESCRQDVLYRQHRSNQSTQPSAATALSFVDDDTFALLYGVFGVKANAIRNAFSQAHQFFADSTDYQTIVSDCEHEYFSIREQLLRPIVHSTIQAFCYQCQNSTCTLTRDSCTFLLRLCDDEFRLYRQFFVLGDLTATRSASMTPTTPVSLLFSFWPVQSNSNQFDTFIEGLCRVLYDTLRPLIVHNPHLETLAQLCSLLKVEMIDERCAALSSSHPNTFPPPFSATSPTEAMMENVSNLSSEMANSRAGFARVMNELVADIVERIVYRTSLFAQSDILEYNPAPGDLVYPERLVMMRDINQGRKLTNSALTESEATPTSTTTESSKTSTATSPSESKIVQNQQNSSSTSPIDQHCLWYPTVRRTVMCLSKLYRCLDSTVFLNVSRELLDACCQSLERAVERICALPINSAHATLRSSSNRSLDAELFIIKHLLILREQISPFRQHNKQQQQSRSVSMAPFSRQSSLNEVQINPQYDYSLDLSKYTQSMFQLLNIENRARWFEFSSNNAFLSLLLLSPVHVSELQTDSRRIIESHLKRWCHRMIGHIASILLGPLATFQSDIDQLQTEQEQRFQGQKSLLDVTTSDRFSPKALHDCCADAFKRLKQHWPEVRAAFALYIGVHETEEILLQPIRKAVSNAFGALNAFAERHYDAEQRQIISAPNQEQIWLILNAIASAL